MVGIASKLLIVFGLFLIMLACVKKIVVPRDKCDGILSIIFLILTFFLSFYEMQI